MQENDLSLDYPAGHDSEITVEEREIHVPDKVASDTCSSDTSLQRNMDEDQKQKKLFPHLVMFTILESKPPQAREYEPIDTSQIRRDNVYSVLSPVSATPKSEPRRNYQLIDTSQMIQDSVYTDTSQMRRDNVYSELSPVSATPKSEPRSNYQLIDTSQMIQDSVYTDLRHVTANSERPHHYQLIDTSKMRQDSEYAELRNATVDIAVTGNVACGIGQRV